MAKQPPAKEVVCKNCGHTWPRDPVLEVVCPQCQAAIGFHCHRPSGHRVYGGEPHASRDLLAAKQGFYEHKCKQPACHCCKEKR